MFQNTAAFFIWADLRIAQLVAFSAGSVLRHYRPTRLVDRLRRTGDCRRWRRAAEELDEAPQVLSGCGQDLIFSPAQASQSKSVELEDSLHVSKTHLDLFAFST